jgi:hypothetical protein
MNRPGRDPEPCAAQPQAGVAETPWRRGCLSANALGNPYPVATFGRDQAVALFRRYLPDRPRAMRRPA